MNLVNSHRNRIFYVSLFLSFFVTSIESRGESIRNMKVPINITVCSDTKFDIPSEFIERHKNSHIYIFISHYKNISAFTECVSSFPKFNDRSAMQRIKSVRDFKLPVLGSYQSFPEDETNRVARSCNEAGFSFLMVYSDEFKIELCNINLRDNSTGDEKCLNKDN